MRNVNLEQKETVKLKEEMEKKYPIKALLERYSSNKEAWIVHEHNNLLTEVIMGLMSELIKLRIDSKYSLMGFAILVENRITQYKQENQNIEKEYEIWYPKDDSVSTNEDPKAQLFGKMKAITFKQACDEYFNDEELLEDYDSDFLTFFKIPVFDNESSAIQFYDNLKKQK